jgi:hypothetical protein
MLPSRDKYLLRAGLRNSTPEGNTQIGRDQIERGTGFEPATSTLGNLSGRLLASTQVGVLNSRAAQAARQELQTHSRLAHSLHQLFYLWDAVCWQAMLSLLEGRFAEAEQLVQQASEMGGRVLSGTSRRYCLGHLFVLRSEQRRLLEASWLRNVSTEQPPSAGHGAAMPRARVRTRKRAR